MRKDFTSIVMILDRSGSMATHKSDTIGGFNEFLEDQKKLSGDAVLTLVQFDDEYEVLHNFINIRDIKPLDDHSFKPRGSTALLDSMGKTINDVGKTLADMQEHERPDRVIVVTVTDGHENASKNFTRESIFDMIKHQKDIYNWHFVFIGANQDAIATGTSLGIMNNMNYNTNKTKQLYGCISSNVGNLRGSCDPQSFNWNPGL